MAGNSERTHLFRLLINVGKLWHHKIFDQSALFTDQMIVRCNFRFEPVKGAAEREFLNISLFRENAQVPVHGPEA